jgi:hypothetical protein
MWNFIPQLFYDFIGRIVPGAILIVTSVFVIFGPSTAAKFVLNLPKDNKLFTFPVFLLFILISYLIGFILSQLWEMAVGKLLVKKERRIEKECMKECLEEHNQLQKALSKPGLDIDLDHLPRPFVMREHIRQVDPSEAARLLKVRAERRLCQVLIIGLFVLLLINAGIAWSLPQPAWSERLTLEVFMGVAAVICWSRSRRLLRHFVNGSCVGWLIRISSGEIPVQKNPLGTLNDPPSRIK